MHTINAHGANIPALGFGTFRMPDAEVLSILPKAMKLGFRHVDTAQIYKNEAAVGEAIASTGIPRDEIFLTTKVWVDRVGHDAFIASMDESLQKLKTDHVDLLLLHWPQSEMPLADRMGALNALRQAGKVTNIGVSNFSTALMDEAIQLSDAPVVNNQIEYHPYIDQTQVIQKAHDTGMSITAYYLMADGAVPKDEVLKEIGAKHGKTAAQVVLRWAVSQRDVIALSKTSTESRLAENYDIFDFELSPEEMQAVHGLSRTDGRIVNPGHLAPTWDR